MPCPILEAGVLAKVYNHIASLSFKETLMTSYQIPDITVESVI